MIFCIAEAVDEDKARLLQNWASRNGICISDKEVGVMLFLPLLKLDISSNEKVELKFGEGSESGQVYLTNAGTKIGSVVFENDLSMHIGDTCMVVTPLLE